MISHIEEDIAAAWAALSTIEKDSGWQAVPVSTIGDCRVLAARHFPENEEAILIGFDLNKQPVSKQLPKGKGFRVEVVSDRQLGGTKSWIGLIRLNTGTSEIFAGMVKDILALVKESSELPSDLLYSIFLGRIRAWQDFMSRPRAALSSEAETGLYGELCFLRLLFQNEVSFNAALESWQGPLDGLQDFYLGSGAVEVKATLADEGFPAKIHSLEQLDDSMLQPMYLSAVRLKIVSYGRTLPELINTIREELVSDQAVLSEFENRLLKAGYLDSHGEHYFRQFSIAEMRHIHLDASFPRLTWSNVPQGIRSARYEIDLDQVNSSGVSADEMFENLGVV
ncbi:hypothetical protein ACH42_09375 [Endozoicomonas sp. (ex Bugula neritina AB1)]|nr:hypothetical protein ACH42_09375 [Endozoicomonas sp. (ex Bugula neritina AB1)]